MIRFSPQGIARINAYRANVNQRIKDGLLSKEEGDTLIAAQMQAEAAGANPTRVRCPDCKAEHSFIGRGIQFVCACSPNTIRSIWDCRIT